MKNGKYYKKNVKLNKFKDNGLIISKFKDKSIIKDLNKIINKYFKKSENFYCKMPLKKFRELAFRCQKEIFKLKIQKRFAESEEEILKSLLQNDVPLFESLIFLRIVRPLKNSNEAEAIDWHRETFYSDHKYIRHGINVWFPIKNVNLKNTLKYIPFSHKVSDNKIKRRKIRMTKDQKLNSVNKKFSASHKMGFVYHPKKIVSGINLNKAKPMNIPKNNYALFSTMLIHGNSQNLHSKIRFALGFGIMPKSKIKKIKKFDIRRMTNKKNNTLNSYASINQI